MHPQPGYSRSPTRARRPSAAHGFLIPPKPKRRAISELSVRELRELHDKNVRLLSSPGPSSSGFIHRVSAEQVEIQSRLVDLVGVEAIRTGLQNTRIDGDNVGDMVVDGPRPISAKQRALEQFATRTGNNPNGAGISYQEAARLEQEALAAERKRHEDQLQRRRKQGLGVPGEVLTREEQTARMWAFLNHKPTESDLEDDSDDGEDDDPSSWFEDDQDDGRKGQNIVDPDPDYDVQDDLSHIIRIDESKIPFRFHERERV